MTLESQRPIRVLLVEHDPEDLGGLRQAVADDYLAKSVDATRPCSAHDHTTRRVR
jgi:hypothetical protein